VDTGGREGDLEPSVAMKRQLQSFNSARPGHLGNREPVRGPPGGGGNPLPLNEERTKEKLKINLPACTEVNALAETVLRHR